MGLAMGNDAPGPDPDPDPSGHLNPEWLEEQYWDEERSVPDIAAECDISNQVVYRAMKRFGIRRRSRSEALNLRHRKRLCLPTLTETEPEPEPEPESENENERTRGADDTSGEDT